MNQLKLGLLVYLALFAFSVQLVAGDVQPSNVALLTGGSTTLECSSSETLNFVQWIFFFTGTSGAVTLTTWDGASCAASPDHPEYGVNATSPGQCDLIINSATVSQSGWYLCGLVASSSVNYAAHVTVLLETPNCVSNSTSNVAQNDDVMVACNVSYTSSGVPVSVTWTGCLDDGITPKDDVIVSGSNATLTSSVVFPAQPPTLSTCTASVSASGLPPPPDFIAGSIPASVTRPYSYSWTSPANINVQFCPTNIQLVPSVADDDTFYPGVEVSCTVDGNPVPAVDLLIQASDGSITVESSPYVLDQLGVYNITCEAFNLITSGQYGPNVCRRTSAPQAYYIVPIPTTECGSIMHVVPPEVPVTSRWGPLCYINRTDTEWLNTRCSDLIQNVPDIGDYNSLISMGGAAGCSYMTTPEDDWTGAGDYPCFPAYQIDLTLAACSICTRLIACFRLP